MWIELVINDIPLGFINNVVSWTLTKLFILQFIIFRIIQGYKTMATSAQVFSHRMFLNILVLFFLFLTRAYMITTVYHRRSQGLSKGESHCVKVRVLTRLSCRPPRRVFHLKQRLKRGLFNHGQDIGVAFSPPFVGCLVKKARQKGGSRAPQDPPWLCPCSQVSCR